ncbi:MAG TPA: hypothetical protein VJY99_15795 [Buttiauxella sp.]|uniref:hypothetical protein n=1 Tax=Buttiauxella sp. TaxID=1972222 RepID=UPI002B49822F|nr:hypothetical protein [Buttiauxella sp.]HKM98137.1 hypothetical protein [Buttiauxella sp.]
MNQTYMAVPIFSVRGVLLGVELKTHFEKEGCRVIVAEKVLSYEERLTELKYQLAAIKRQSEWFISHGLYCVLPVAADVAEELSLKNAVLEHPFLRLMVSTAYNTDLIGEDFWLDGLGSYHSTALPLTTGKFEALRLQPSFVEETINSEFFPTIMKVIRKYCDRIIVIIRDKEHLSVLEEAGVWAVQREHQAVVFDECSRLISFSSINSFMNDARLEDIDNCKII